MPATQTSQRREVKALGDSLKEQFGDIRRTHVYVGTWLKRAGSSLTLHLDSKSTGKRIIVHKWDSEDLCSVRHIKGDFWRDPDSAVEYGEVSGVGYNTTDIAIAIGSFDF